MKKENEKIKYGRYCRKSEEDKNKQVNSIEDQERDLNATESKESLDVVIKFPGESQSAFSPGRPIFAEVVRNIEAGKINALLVWHANRIARNPIDAGTIIYLMDTGKLKEIKTPSKVYNNNANDKFMLNLDFSMSKKDSDDKSEVVKRALEGRAFRGLPSGVSKVGFLNDTSEEKGNRKWIVDEIRFPLVQQLLEKMITGKYSPAQIYRYSKDELKLTTVNRKKVGGKPVAYSYIYSLLRDPIFAGFFYYKGQRCELDKRLPRAISEDDYWKIQAMLGKKGRPQPSKHESLYSHFLCCGECNGRMSADFKFQLICPFCKCKFACKNTDTCPKCKTEIEKMVNPIYCSYIYYYCVNNKKHRTICLNTSIEQKQIEKTIYNKFINEICISKDLSDWCLKHLAIIKDEEIKDESSVIKSIEDQEAKIKEKLNNLLSYRIRRENVTPEQEEIFDAQENKLQQELSDLRQRKNTKVDWFSEAVKEFNLMAKLEKILESGTFIDKKDALYELRSNLTIKDKNLIVSNRKSINAFADCILRTRSENEAFEPKTFFFKFMNKGSNEKTEKFFSVFPSLLRIVQDVRTIFEGQNEYIYIPDLRKYSNV